MDFSGGFVVCKDENVVVHIIWIILFYNNIGINRNVSKK